MMNSSKITQISHTRGSLMLEGRGAEEKYALISFVSKGKGEQLVKITRRYQALGNTIMLGRGTARSEILDYLGLEGDEKEVVVSCVCTDRAQPALQALRKKLKMDRPGHGISFLIPIIDSKGLKAIFRLAEQVDQNNPEIAAWEDPASIADEGIIFAQHDLITVVLQADAAEEAMDYAREAGAVGGTMLHGRSWKSHEGNNLLDSAVEPGREILLMLVQKQNTKPILKTLYKKLGSNRPGGYIAFALPVSAVTGLADRLTVREDGSVIEQTHHS